MGVLLIVLGSVLLALTLSAAAMFGFMRWYDRQTDGTAYYARSSDERRAFKRQLARHARWILPLVRLFTRVVRPREPASIELDGVTGPAQTCTRELFARTRDYRPVAGDVFVATQMKCGTTWMQQLVYELLSRGHGDLGDAGHRHMYALSPWIESRHSVSLADAPRVGMGAGADGGARIIKTHMPVALCPYAEEARYIYVTRDPVACFASCVDFLGMLGGPFIPPAVDLVDWYCSDRMWWRSWPEHVEGWWRWAEERPNVMFVHYETMLDDLPGVVDRVAAFLETPLSPAERRRVVEKSGFEYMKAHEDVFEMSPPTPFSAGGVFLKSGGRDRGRDVGEAGRARILAFCRERLAGASYPLERFYPEVAEKPPA